MLGVRRCSCREETLARRRIAFKKPEPCASRTLEPDSASLFFEDEAEVAELSRERGFCIAELELSCDWLEEGANRGP